MQGNAENSLVTRYNVTLVTLESLDAWELLSDKVSAR